MTIHNDYAWRTFHVMISRRIALSLLLTTLFVSTHHVLSAQQADGDAPVRFGLFLGGNFNMLSVDGNLNSVIPGITVPLSQELTSGSGLGLYSGLMFEYAPTPDGIIGFQARFDYDNRSASMSEGTDTVDGSLAYFAVEPGVRVNLGGSGLHLMVGPGLHILGSNSVDVSAGDQTQTGLENSNQKDLAFGVWGGLGYDIPLSKLSSSGSKWYLAPFLEASWMPGQLETGVGDDIDPDAAWSTITARAGLQLKYGTGGQTNEPMETPPPAGDLNLAIQTPAGGVMSQRPMIEYLPVLNYLFYNDSETEIPSRYSTLSPAQARLFNENSMEAMDSPSAGDPSESTRSRRQLDVYYNTMNILADRLKKNPSESITVVGSGPDLAAATARAETVRNYIVTSFGIPADRVSSRGQKKPVHPSGTASTPKGDRGMVAEENIRVELIGNEAILGPVKLKVLQDMPVENDMAIDVSSASPIQRWDLRVQGDGFDRTYGPFYGDRAYVNSTPILGDRRSGTYIATVTATDRAGVTMTASSDFKLEKTSLDPVTSTRYSILFGYNDGSSMERYEKFIRNTVAPNVPNGSIVYIHGHTDVAGSDEYNYQLSVERAVAAEKILADELKKNGKEDITFESYGFGETEYRAPFANDLPESRHYNRTVMIEIIPDAD